MQRQWIRMSLVRCTDATKGPATPKNPVLDYTILKYKFSVEISRRLYKVVKSSRSLRYHLQILNLLNSDLKTNKHSDEIPY